MAAHKQSSHIICGKSTQRTRRRFVKDLGAARSRLGSAHDVMPRVVVVVMVVVVVVVVVQIPASREAELGRHMGSLLLASGAHVIKIYHSFTIRRDQVDRVPPRALVAVY